MTDRTETGPIVLWRAAHGLGAAALLALAAVTFVTLPTGSQGGAGPTIAPPAPEILPVAAATTTMTMTVAAND